MTRPLSTLTLLAALAALAVAVFPAAAMAQPRGLAVTASLAGCHEAGTGTVCQVDVTFETIEGADSYTAMVKTPAGSTEDLGQVGAGSASLPVSYAGNGRYVVTISAWADATAGAKQRLARDASR